ncbi:polysaccharide biosynthesis protein [Acidicapsa acidisoli]|uniref:polysaccharide biosynthesis protein n=1 Tax=Acidicapsa acidisoli TaxID=1615681 RepID=UPI0021E0B495|nr:polysaccharide biosynthesis protein [Acidicapsa acidisoli]
MPSVPHSASKDTAIDWYTFLARPRLPSPAPASLAPLRDTSVLVTGAGGSIGCALSLELARLQPRQLLLLDASEQALHRLQSLLGAFVSTSNCHLILGNIVDLLLLEELFEAHRPDFIFHAAAHKHVSLLEGHPLEAIANNSLGTLTLAQCAKHSSRIVLLSTDKAVTPISILGATKRIAERITLANNGVVVRLGNILGSEGSVSETFLRQIHTGGPITVTDPEAQRYFLTLEEAVDILLTSAVAAPSGSTLVPLLAQQNSVASLAEFLIAASPNGVKPAIKHTGLHPGEKFREALWSDSEQPFLTQRHGYFEINEPMLDHSSLRQDLIHLAEVVQMRDLPRAIEIVQKLVPDYDPSESIMQRILNTTQRTLQQETQS